jgi:hypothetical protein
MNLLTVAPLVDIRGNIRYFIGAQIDVTGLCGDCTKLDSLKRLIERQEALKEKERDPTPEPVMVSEGIDEFQELAEMFSDEELEIVRHRSERLQIPVQVETPSTLRSNTHRIHVSDSGNDGYDASTSYKQSINLKYPSLFQNVSTSSRFLVGLANNDLVARRSPIPVSQDHLYLSFATNSGNVTVTTSQSYRRLFTRS